MGADIQDVDGDGRPDLLATNFRGQYTHAVPEPGRAELPRRERAGRADQGQPPLRRLGLLAGGLRQRRSPGPGGRQRRGGRQPPRVRPGVRLRPADHRPPQPRSGRVRPAWRTPARGPRSPAPPAAWPSATSTTTATSTWSSRCSTPSPLILANESPRPGNWIRFDLVGARGGRGGDRRDGRESTPGAGCSRGWSRAGTASSRPTIAASLVGLGAADRVEEVEILWPGGGTTTLLDPEPRRTHRVVEPTGDPKP